MFMEQSKLQMPTSSQMLHSNSTLTGNRFNNYKAPYNQYTLESVEVLRHVCPVCNKTFRASSLLDIHMRVHVGAKPFVCPVCNHRATQKGNLKLHMKKHHGQDLPSHIDLVPDSGIWGNFPVTPTSVQSDENDFQMGCKKRATRAHSSLLNKDVVDLIKKCQNNIGQSTMGRITESLNDFISIAQNKASHPALGKAMSVEDGNALSCEYHHNASKSIAPTVANKLAQPMQFSENHFADHEFDSVKTLNAHSTSPEDSQKNFCYCKICGWKTTSSGYLNVHMRKHKAESHICTICGRAFKETWYLKNHMRSHINDLAQAPEKPWGNGFQSFRQISMMQLAREAYFLQNYENLSHRLDDHEAMYGMCSRCGLVFTKFDLEEHNLECNHVKLDIEICKCCLSDNGSPYKDAFMGSLGLSSKGKTKKHCQQNNSFNPVIGLFVVHEKPDEKPFVEKSLENIIALSKRQLLAYPSKEKGVMQAKEKHSNIANSIQFSTTSPHVQSDSVDMPETVKNNLLHRKNSSDVEQSHTNNKPSPYRNSAMQSLALIGKSLGTQETQQDWIVKQEDIGGDNNQQYPHGFQCQFCPKWFKYRSVLGIHMRSHTGERPYKCTYCDYAGTQHNCLKLHLQRRHPKEYQKNYVDGPATANGKNDLAQEHLLLGQAAKFSPARCPICGRMSPSPGYLKIHMRSHKKSLDHVCHICGRGFKEYWYLSTHLRTHDRELSFPSLKDESVSVETTENQQNVQTALRNTLLSKRLSYPMTRDSGLSGHSYLTGSSSWSPLNAHENPQGSRNFHFMDSDADLPTQSHVSKRKAFQPSRHPTEPYYLQHEATRSRKSKPRKLARFLSHSPVTQRSPPPLIVLTDENFPKASSVESKYCHRKSLTSIGKKLLLVYRK
ncbi:unnamed protein product [Clavelina lepadiformis]|uniref:C2H2-type domain-containing protein n=1 Tax=Clavelina lepadiformis TaxID=159417 RepID=A0ABP0GWG0_CLALP